MIVSSSRAAASTQLRQTDNPLRLARIMAHEILSKADQDGFL
jgi:hypothetical protein